MVHMHPGDYAKIQWLFITYPLITPSHSRGIGKQPGKDLHNRRIEELA